MKNHLKSSAGVDVHLVRDMVLTGANDYNFYSGFLMAVEKNLVKKGLKGALNKDLVLIAYSNGVSRLISIYGRIAGSRISLTPKEKAHLSKELMEENYDSVLTAIKEAKKTKSASAKNKAKKLVAKRKK